MDTFKQSLVLLACALCTTASIADNKAFLQQASDKLGKTVESSRSIDGMGLLELTVEGKQIYVDKELKFALAGRLLDLNRKIDVTAQRSRQIYKEEFDKLPLHLAIVRKHGNGKRNLVIFADPNCKYCKHLEEQLKLLDNVTLITFMLGALSEDSTELARDVWCAKDKALAWESWMLRQERPPEGQCKTPNEEVMKLAQVLKVSSTPTFLFGDGTKVSGTIPLTSINTLLESPRIARDHDRSRTRGDQ